MNKQGFTLVELLVAGTIFIIATSAFTYGLRVCLSNYKSASALNKAIYTLQSETEKIKTVPFAQLIKIKGKTFAAGKGKVSVSALLPDLLKIKIELAWLDNKDPLEVYTLRSQYE